MSRSAGRRRRGRELALRVLFELEGTEKEPRPALEYQADDMGAPRDTVEFARTLVEGTLGHVVHIDAAISEASVNWDLVDYGKVERAVLRLGTYEGRELIAEPASRGTGTGHATPAAAASFERSYVRSMKPASPLQRDPGGPPVEGGDR